MNIYIQRTRKLTFSSFTCWVSFSSSSHSDDSPIPSSLSIFIALSAHRCPCAVSSHQLPTRGGPPPQHFAFKRSVDPPISCALDPLEAIDNVRDVYTTSNNADPSFSSLTTTSDLVFIVFDDAISHLQVPRLREPLPLYLFPRHSSNTLSQILVDRPIPFHKGTNPRQETVDIRL